MPTRQQTLTAATQIFESSVFPSGTAAAPTACAGIPHVVDSNRLTVPPKANGQPRAWQAHAIAAEGYFAQQWGVSAHQVHGMVDRLMQLPGYRGLQRNNILGSAFAGLLRYVLQAFGGSGLTYELESPGKSTFPGVEIGRAS